MKIKMFLTLIAVFFSAVACSVPASATEDITVPEIHITKDGKVEAQGLLVQQIAGTTIFSKTSWGGGNFLRFTITTNSSTKILRRYGEVMPFSEISVGNYIVVKGTISSGSDSLMIAASEITNMSSLTGQMSFSGTVVSIISSNSFTMNDKKLGVITVDISNTNDIVKGNITILSSNIKVGDKVTSVTGTYNYDTKILKAQRVKIYRNMAPFKPKNFTGVLKTAPGTVFPMTVIVTIGGKNYNVKLSETTEIRKNNKSKTQISRFAADDRVKLYGHIEETEEMNIIDAEIIRNLDL
ncbi:MAG: hypothetical protein PHP03_01675 [Candidatus Pacebacteria bacterium]|nr:hypothetical protein [Candidatus Paceibacterota bacterium]